MGMGMGMDTPAPLTLGESLAHLPRTFHWVMAVFCQIVFPVGFTWPLVYLPVSTEGSSFFTSVPWRIMLVLSYGAYWSVLLLVTSYARLFLPRTPVAIVEKIQDIGGWAVGGGVLSVMVSVVLGSKVEDTYVLAGCTCVVAVSVAGLVALWVWLARTYGGGASDQSSTVPAAGQQLPRAPI